MSSDVRWEPCKAAEAVILIHHFPRALGKTPANGMRRHHLQTRLFYLNADAKRCKGSIATMAVEFRTWECPSQLGLPAAWFRPMLAAESNRRTPHGCRHSQDRVLRFHARSM